MTVSIVSVFLALTMVSPKLAAKSSDEVNLFQVKTIFLQANQNTEIKEWAVNRLRLLSPALKGALVSYGFKVVTNSLLGAGYRQAVMRTPRRALLNFVGVNMS